MLARKSKDPSSALVPHLVGAVNSLPPRQKEEFLSQLSDTKNISEDKKADRQSMSNVTETVSTTEEDSSEAEPSEEGLSEERREGELKDSEEDGNFFPINSFPLPLSKKFHRPKTSTDQSTTPTSLNQLFVKTNEILLHSLAPLIDDIHYKPLAHPLRAVLHAKTTSTVIEEDNESEESSKEIEKARLLYGISKQVSKVAIVIMRNNFLYEQDKEEIILLKVKAKFYPEELYKLADCIIPFITGLLLAGIYFGISYFFFLPLWFAALAPTVGLAVGKNINLSPPIHNKFRTAIVHILSFFGGHCTRPLKPGVDALISITEQTSFGAENSNSSSKKIRHILRQLRPKEKKEVIPREYKEKQPAHLCFFNDKILCSQPKNPTDAKTELDALYQSIEYHFRGKEDNVHFYKPFHNLYLTLQMASSKINAARIDNYIEGNNTVRKNNYIRKMAQQTRFLLEALYFSSDDNKKLDHFLLLQVKAQEDPNEWNWLAQYVVSVLSAVILASLCILCTHYVMMGTFIVALDMLVGMALSSKENSCDLAAAPTASRISLDYLALWLFRNSTQNQVDNIGKHIKDSSKLEKADPDDKNEHEAQALIGNAEARAFFNRAC